MAAYPAMLESSKIEFTPVDYVTKAIVYLRQVPYLDKLIFLIWQYRSLKPSSIGEAFHLTSPPVLYKTIFAAISSYGYLLDAEQLTEVWAAELYEMPENLLYPYLDMFSRNVVPYTKEVNDFRTKQALNCSDITCPPANETLFHAYLRFMHQNKLILEPDPTTAPKIPLDKPTSEGRKIRVSVINGGDI